jgi:hypothetical protein
MCLECRSIAAARASPCLHSLLAQYPFDALRIVPGRRCRGCCSGAVRSPAVQRGADADVQRRVADSCPSRVVRSVRHRSSPNSHSRSSPTRGARRARHEPLALEKLASSRSPLSVPTECCCGLGERVSERAPPDAASGSASSCDPLLEAPAPTHGRDPWDAKRVQWHRGLPRRITGRRRCIGQRAASADSGTCVPLHSLTTRSGALRRRAAKTPG